jgi:hypothetical protein
MGGFDESFKNHVWRGNSFCLGGYYSINTSKTCTISQVDLILGQRTYRSLPGRYICCKHTRGSPSSFQSRKESIEYHQRREMFRYDGLAITEQNKDHSNYDYKRQQSKPKIHKRADSRSSTLLTTPSLSKRVESAAVTSLASHEVDGGCFYLGGDAHCSCQLLSEGNSLHRHSQLTSYGECSELVLEDEKRSSIVFPELRKCQDGTPPMRAELGRRCDLGSDPSPGLTV